MPLIQPPPQLTELLQTHDDLTLTQASDRPTRNRQKEAEIAPSRQLQPPGGDSETPVEPQPYTHRQGGGTQQQPVPGAACREPPFSTNRDGSVTYTMQSGHWLLAPPQAPGPEARRRLWGLQWVCPEPRCLDSGTSSSAAVLFVFGTVTGAIECSQVSPWPSTLNSSYAVI